MEDDVETSRDGDHRRVDTPTRDTSRHGRRIAAHERSRSRSRLSRHSRSSSRCLRERELDLARERERILVLERDLQKARDEEYRRGRSESRRHAPARSSQRQRSERPGREVRSISRDEPRRDQRQHGDESHSRDPGASRPAKRSCSPSFSSKDVLNLIQSLKGDLASQPINQSAHSTRKSLDSKNILPEFDPSTKNQRMDVWIKKVNECASVYGWDERTIIHFAMQKLQGLAKTWYEGLNTILFTWPEWQEKLTNAFPCEQNYGQSLEEMLQRKSRYNEPIERYYYEKLALLNQCDITGKRAVDCIIHGISDKTMKSSALALRCTVPDQLLSFLLSNRDTSSTQLFLSRNKASGGIGSSEKDQSNRMNPRATSSGMGVYCYNCKERGHPYLKCPKPLIKCNKCNLIGHKTEVCRAKRDALVTKPDELPKTMCISSSNANDKFIKDVTANEVPMEAFIDFGSEVTLIKESIVKELGVQHDCKPSTMIGFGKGQVTSVGSVILRLSVDGVKATVSCRVINDCLLDRPLLIGQSFSEQPHVVVYKDATKLQFLDIGAEMPNYGTEDVMEPMSRIRVAGQNTLYGSASVRAATDTKFSGSVLLDTKVVGKPNEQCLILGGIYQVMDGSLHVTVMPSSIPCLLQENAVFSRAERIEVVNRIIMTAPDACSLEHRGKADSVMDESQIRLGESVSEDDKTKLIDLLKRYEHCFASDLNDLGCTDVTEMKIEVNNQRPVVYRPYRLSHHERDKVRGMIEEMLKAGIIRESVSDYASPIILVRKKDGNVRMCIDYRMLNSVTVKERYPMPIIEDEIARLSGQAWFITLDLMSGYYQVPISEQSKHVTAFVTPDGHYEFNRMPFGLANAPAVFQRMMNRVLGSARFDKATVYIDDLLVFGKSSEEALERLEEILKLLESANLKLNLSKCCFLENKIAYLGYEISSQGMRPGEAKIQSVANFPRPENVHGVRQFVGLVSYFRKFIQGFAQLAYPLTKLLKKDRVWEWTDSQEEAFKILKTKLIERPVLAIYDPSAVTELHTDASRIGVGAILLQRSHSDQSLQPVAYYSRQTTPEEKNFHSYELETLAVVCALKKFRVFLLGKEFRIVTDCSALRSTFQKRDLIPRIARWWLTLQEFDCSVEYRPGTKMSHVDALSRNPVADTQDTEHTTVMAISDEDWLLTLQLGDSELSRIRDTLNSNLDSRGLEYIKENYVIRDNKLFKCLKGDKNNVRWVVPKGARWQLCKMNHDDIGHVGFEKTLERIKRNYWFAKMSRFVKKYVGACIECAYAKKSAGSKEGLLHPIAKVDVPFHTLHIDHLGPFVKSKRGQTYILVVIDSFTKFVFIRAVRNTKTQNVIKVLEDIFDTFRTPDRLVSDRGSCFTSNAFKKFCLDRGFKHILNAVASPRSNGQVERYNRTILDSLTAQNLKDNEKDWDTQLGKIQWGLNNTIQKTTGRAPSEVMFGTAMNGEVTPILNEILNETRETSDLSVIRKDVKSKIDREQIRQKQYFDKGRKPARVYNKGDLVKITKTVFANDGKSKKLLPSYEGPLRVKKVLGNDRYKLAPIRGFEGTKNKRNTTVAADRMQPWIHMASLDIDDDQDTVNETVNDASGLEESVNDDDDFE